MSVERLRETALLFLRLGLTTFGGPAAHVAILEDEVVQRRRWITRERFLDLLGMANLIPGPSSTELAMFLGYERAGLAGWLIAGVCFILPAAAITGALAWAYVRFGAMPATSTILYGVKPVVIAIVAEALWRLAPSAIRGSWALRALGGVACVAAARGADPAAVLVASGLAAATGCRLARRASGDVPAVFLAGLAGTRAATLAPASLAKIFLVFLKIGSVAFGSGYVLLALLRTELVEHRQWLNERQLLDAVAVGQVTPGPVFTTATFVGYLLGGARGAALATVGIFLPGFLLVAVSRPVVQRMRRSETLSAFLDGVNVAAVAVMVVVTALLAGEAVVDIPTAILAAGGAVVLVRFRPNAAWVLLMGGAAGVLLKAAGANS